MLAGLILSALLDVPYMAQTPELCGGAAVAMVMRYWGAKDVFPQDFAPLVSAADAGILTGTLTTAVRARGWRARVVPETDGRAGIQRELDAGRPLIALISVGPRTFHYVVIVGLTDENIVVHDPARAPFRVLTWSEFARAWATAERWLMLMLPPEAMTMKPGVISNNSRFPSAATTACSALVDHGVELALDGKTDESERVLTTALGVCPHDPSPRREMAGLRFSQKRWPEARQFAFAALRLAPDDAYSWQLVATSYYASGDSIAALAAWNHTGQPRVDTIDVKGVERTPQPIIVRATALQPRQLLTPSALQRAERRLDELPVAVSSRVTYVPADGERAAINVFVDERPLVGRSWSHVASLVASAIYPGRVRVDVAGALGAGDREHIMWRWQSARPRFEAGLAIPSPSWLPGNVSFDMSWERQTYRSAAAAGDSFGERRRRAGLSVADWATGSIRWQAGAALDRFDSVDHLSFDGALDVRMSDDTFGVSASGNWWTPFGDGRRLASGRLAGAWRSSRDTSRQSLSARADVVATGEHSPLALWPGAGTGLGRPGLLRAHRLVHDGVIDLSGGAVFGRRVASGTLEYARPLKETSGASVSIAVFADAARAWHRLTAPGTSPLYIDAGVGLRLGAPGQSSAFRLDLAHGLRGGGLTLSAGWVAR